MLNYYHRAAVIPSRQTQPPQARRSHITSFQRIQKQIEANENVENHRKSILS